MIKERPNYDKVSLALKEAHLACLQAKNVTGEVLGMSSGSFKGVNETLGIVAEMEEELHWLRKALAKKSKRKKKEAENEEQETRSAAPIPPAPQQDSR